MAPKTSNGLFFERARRAGITHSHAERRRGRFNKQNDTLGLDPPVATGRRDISKVFMTKNGQTRSLPSPRLLLPALKVQQEEAKKMTFHPFLNDNRDLQRRGPCVGCILWITQRFGRGEIGCRVEFRRGCKDASHRESGHGGRGQGKTQERRVTYHRPLFLLVAKLKWRPESLTRRRKRNFFSSLTLDRFIFKSAESSGNLVEVRDRRALTPIKEDKSGSAYDCFRYSCALLCTLEEVQANEIVGSLYPSNLTFFFPPAATLGGEDERRLVHVHAASGDDQRGDLLFQPNPTTFSSSSSARVFPWRRQLSTRPPTSSSSGGCAN